MINADIFLIFAQHNIVVAEHIMAVIIIRTDIKRCVPSKNIEYEMWDKKKHIVNVTNPLYIKVLSLQVPSWHSAESRTDPALYPIRKNHINEIKFISQSAGIIPDGSSLYIVSYGLSEKILTKTNISANAIPKNIPVLLEMLFRLQDDLLIYPPTN